MTQNLSLSRNRTRNHKKDTNRNSVQDAPDFMAAFDEINDSVFVHDMQTGDILHANRKACSMYGFSSEEFRGMSVAQLSAEIPPYNIANAVDLIHQAVAGNDQRFEWLAKDRVGREFWVEVNLRRAHLDGQEVLLTLVRDIDRSKRLENIQKALLAISEASGEHNDIENYLNFIAETLRPIVTDGSDFYIAIYDGVNQSYKFPCVICSRKSSDLAGSPMLTNLLHHVRQSRNVLIAGPEQIGMINESSVDSNEAVPLVWVGVPLRVDDRIFGVVAVQNCFERKLYGVDDENYAAGVSQHIAAAIARKKTEDELRESEQKNRSLIESIPDCFLVVDMDLRILFANSSASKLSGYSADEILNLNLLDVVVKEDHELLLRQRNSRKANNKGQYELTIRRKDGELRNLLISAVPVAGPNKEVTCSMVIARDITESKRIEKEKQELKDRLARAQRMESLGLLAGGVAHDLNNILGPLAAYPEMIKAHLQPDSPALEYLAKIESSASRAAEAVQDLLMMARRERYDMSLLDLNSVVKDFIESPEFCRLKQRYPTVETEISLAENPLMINGSFSHLRRLVMNLVLNAFDALTPGGKLKISTESKKIDKLINGFDKIEKGDYAILVVSDNGIGIDENDLKRIFEPFYSKKHLGRSGSGLGLSIVYGIVKDHNGYIDVCSAINSGTEFIVYLPLHNVDAFGKGSTAVDIRGNERILVVDDMNEQRELASIILGSLGYTVSVAASGEEAIKMIASGDFDIVVLDMIMEGGMDGLETYLEILKVKPELKVIIASGYSESDRVVEAERKGVRAYIKKPYTMQQLGRLIRNVLAGK